MRSSEGALSGSGAAAGSEPCGAWIVPAVEEDELAVGGYHDLGGMALSTVAVRPQPGLEASGSEDALALPAVLLQEVDEERVEARDAVPLGPFGVVAGGTALEALRGGDWRWLRRGPRPGRYGFPDRVRGYR